MDNNSRTITTGELIDGLIVDCSNAVGAMTQGKYILWCRTMTEMARKLCILKDGVAQAIAAKDKTIEDLKAALKESDNNVGGEGA